MPRGHCTRRLLVHTDGEPLVTVLFPLSSSNSAGQRPAWEANTVQLIKKLTGFYGTQLTIFRAISTHFTHTPPIFWTHLRISLPPRSRYPGCFLCTEVTCAKGEENAVINYLGWLCKGDKCKAKTHTHTNLAARTANSSRISWTAQQSHT